MKKLFTIFITFALLIVLVSCDNIVTKKDPETKNYEITYVVSGDSVNEVKKSYVENTIINESDIDIELSKEGYQAESWYLDQACSNAVIFPYTVTKTVTFYLKWTPITTSSIEVKHFGGYDEAAYIEIAKNDSYNLNDYDVSYKLNSDSTYTSLDKSLIRQYNTMIRAEILGLKPGSYNIKVTAKTEEIIKNVTVSKKDRSGYAHFKATEAIGAYNNDGTLKANATVVYVSDQTKNTVKATIGGKTVTGLVNILKAQANSNTPLNIRILGTINAATWNSITYNKGSSNLTEDKILDQNGNPLPKKNLDQEEIISAGYNSMSNDLAKGITVLDGLTNRIKYSNGEFDSYYNMCDIVDAKNVTVEGVGTDAGLFQWGFTWKNCSNIEVSNLTFDKYTEDACSFEGPDDSLTLNGFTTGRIWIHNNTFNEGHNYWDVCPEQDKKDGDGATDFKRNAYITVSYNHYYKNHKTGLVGGSDSQHTASITFHHNYYESCNSRLPLGRQANMHMYNNYYYGSTGTNMSIRAGGYALVENCVFENTNNPMTTQSWTSNGIVYKGVIKSYNNILTNCKGTNSAVVASTRDQLVTNDNIYNKNFDTDSNDFYYNSATKQTDVTNMLDTLDVKEYCKNFTGNIKTTSNVEEPSPEPTPTPTPTPSPNPDPADDLLVLSFNNFLTGNLTGSLNNNILTIVHGAKSNSINSFETPFSYNDQDINNFLTFGGSGSYEKDCVKFTTRSISNITVYYSANKSGRSLSLSDGTTVKKTTVDSTSATDIVYDTFTNLAAGDYALYSTNSSINIVLIIIEYQS